MNRFDDPRFIQGTPEWLSFRKTKITATDAPIIMKKSPWSTPLKLYNEKVSPTDQLKNISPSMQRGIELEPIARELFCIKMNVEVIPQVIVKDWQMASLDGLDAAGKFLVEIKCPGPEDHALALEKKIPAHYQPQLQHQMYVCGLDHMYYFSFDGTDGVVVDVDFDKDYTEELIEEEKKFYECLQLKIAPEPSDRDYYETTDPLWLSDAQDLKYTRDQLKYLQEREEAIKQRMILSAGGIATRGGGVSLSPITRRGNVDYSKIPALKGLDLEPYRKPATTSWRVNVS